MKKSTKSTSGSPNISRRSLIQGALGASGTALAAPIATHNIGSAALAAQDSTPSSEPRAGGTMTLAFPQKTSYSNFNHFRIYAGGENIYSRAFVNAKLLTANLDQSDFIPDLAESWEFTEDGKRITFHLRSGLTWHDGAPFTSKDIDFTFHMIGVPGLGPYNQGAIFNNIIVGNLEWINGEADHIEGLTTPDELTVVFDLVEPFSDDVLFGNFNSITIGPDHILHEFLDRDKATELEHSEWATTAKTVGLGPFRVIEYVPDQYIIYEPFENYYRGRPLLDKLIYRSFQDSQTNIAALENKEVDVARIGAADFARLQKLDFLSFITPSTFNLIGSPFNTRQPYLAKPVRQALVSAIDREAIIQTLYAGTVDIVHSPISVPKYGDSPNLTKYDYDPERAKHLLEEAGWDPDRKIRWAVTELPSSEADQSYYAAINGYWEAVGVKAEFQVVGSETAQMGPPDFNFDLYNSAYPLGSPTDVAPHYDPRLATYVSAGYDEPGFTDLWDQARKRQSDEETQQVIWKLQEIISEECLGLWISRVVDIWGVNQRVHDVHPMYAGGRHLYDWELEKTWVDE